MDEYDSNNQELYHTDAGLYSNTNDMVLGNLRNESEQEHLVGEGYENLFNNGDEIMKLDGYKAGTDKGSIGQIKMIGNSERIIEEEPIGFDMFGEFKGKENMELDESPPFNVDMDRYFDPLLDGKEISHETNSFNSNPNLQNLNTREEMDTTEYMPRVPSQQSFIPHTTSFTNANNRYFPDSQIYNDRRNVVTNNIDNDNSISNASINMHNANYYNELSPLTTTTSLTPSAGSIHSTQPSFFSAQQHFTRNSLDQPPSHHTRHSLDVYSKNRTSFDSQHSSVNQRQRNPVSGRYTSFTNSISNYIPFMSDRNQRASELSPQSDSISPESPQSTNFINTPSHAQQSKQLIRSIFKSSTLLNNGNNMDNANPSLLSDRNLLDKEFTKDDNHMDSMVDDAEFLTNPVKYEPEYDDMSLGTKKARRSKRSLFTRFKTPIKAEPIDEGSDLFKTEESNLLFNNSKTNTIPENDDNESMDPNLLGNLNNQLPSYCESSLDSNSKVALDTASLEYSNNNISNIISAGQQLEPDYAALFENVGKRKNIVNPAAYIRSKPKHKNDTSETNSINGTNNNSNSATEKSSIINNSTNGKSQHEDSEGINVLDSNDSSLSRNYLQSEMGDTDSDLDDSVTSNTNTNTSSSLATASKRILGSKLMSKRKPPQTQNSVPAVPTTKVISKGVEVEVDLLSLDLPPTTQIFPTSIINSKSRTRGRKENKEADMYDKSKIYLCNYCSRRFKRQEHLKRHFRSLHTFEKPYDCPICHKKFSRSDNLNQHLKIHKQEEELVKQGLEIPDSVKKETQSNFQESQDQIE